MSSQLDPHELERLLKGIPHTRAPDDLWQGVQSALRTGRPTKSVPILLRPVRSPSLAAAAVVIATVVGMYVGAMRTFAVPQRWDVVTLSGTPTIGNQIVSEKGDLEQGEWLVTDAQSTAEISVGRIGSAALGPNGRLRLDSSRGRDHRLTLARGQLEAFIAAPPRLFFVATPAVLATDLGCAYTLTVDSTGATRIHVTAGWVELEERGRRALVPAGFVARVPMGGVPGTPFTLDLSAAGQEALERLDRGLGDSATVSRVFQELSPDKDGALTLWHLVQRHDGDLQAMIYDRMSQFSPPPDGVTREGILRLNRPMLERWRRDLRPMWSEEAQPLLVRVARRLWEWTM